MKSSGCIIQPSHPVVTMFTMQPSRPMSWCTGSQVIPGYSGRHPSHRRIAVTLARSAAWETSTPREAPEEPEVNCSSANSAAG